MRTFVGLVAALALGIASSAGALTAVSLTMTTDKSTYNVGENIIVTMVGDTAGAAAAETVFAYVNYDNPGLVNSLGGLATQSAAITSLGGALAWVATNPGCSAGGCIIMNQLSGVGPVTPDPAIIIGTLTLPTIATGVLEISTGVATFTWFGVAVPAAITVTIVPETSSVPALGIVALGGLASALAVLGFRSLRRRSEPG